MDFYGTILVVKMVDMYYIVPEVLSYNYFAWKMVDMNNTVPDGLFCNYFSCKNAINELYSF